jgi:hypothetical protein
VSKRNSYFADGINLVEIDLLRGGKRMHLGRPAPPAADYYVVVCQGDQFPQTGIWPISLRDPLPSIPVPLDPDAGTVTLPLQACFQASYALGSYEKEIDYARPFARRLGWPMPSGSRSLWGRPFRRHRATISVVRAKSDLRFPHQFAEPRDGHPVSSVHPVFR